MTPQYDPKDYLVIVRKEIAKLQALSAAMKACYLDGSLAALCPICDKPETESK